MKQFRALMMLLGLGLAGQSHAAPLAADQMAAMRAADIVILGEIHDNGAHHLLQAEIVKTLAPAAIVFEMLSPEQAELIDAAAMSDIAGLGDLIGWEASGWPDFALYGPLFEAIGTARVVGAALPRDEVRRAFQEGAASPFGPDAVDFGLTVPLAADQQEVREEMQFTAHCAAMPRDLMGGMVEAQRLRDAHFARTALRAVKNHGTPVVVITGNGHARRDWGIPAILGLAAPDLQVFSLGLLEAPASPSDPRFDASIVTDPAPRGDPCAALSQTD
ncbi:MAG: ChaN family lipoprotein [Sulfitobacter sp.]|nr:ChaN family lipoprotein [Sulfitobacter sp.]